MDIKKKLEVANREIMAIGQCYRNDWSGFDGRTLRDELNRLSDWIESDTEIEFTEFSERLESGY